MPPPPEDRRFVITLSCPDRTGIVARISGFLADLGAWITEAGYHADVDAKVFCTRQVVDAASVPFGVEELRRRFDTVATELGAPTGSVTPVSASASCSWPPATSTACTTCSDGPGPASSPPRSPG